MSDPLRLLYVGPFNSPHVEDLAIAMRERGHDVRAGGEEWAGGLPPSSLPEHGVPTSSMTFPSVLWLHRLLREFRPDVVHTHWMPFAMLAVAGGARPVVAQAWGSDVYLAGRRHRFEMWVALRRTAVAMTDSADLVARLRRIGPRTLRVMLLNWGVDLSVFTVPSADDRSALKNRLGLGTGPVIFSPRGTKGVYNPAVVFGAFERLHAAVPDAQLVVKHSGALEDLPAEWREAPGVHIVGYLERERFVDFLRAADVTLSLAASDSSPRSVWEAMAAGSATVVSDLPWVHELIVDGRDALVVGADADAVASAIERLLTDQVLYDELMTSARDLVERHRNRETELTRLEECYLELAGR